MRIVWLPGRHNTESCKNNTHGRMLYYTSPYVHLTLAVFCPLSSASDPGSLVRVCSARPFHASRLWLSNVSQPGWSDAPWGKWSRCLSLSNSRGLSTVFLIFAGSKINRRGPLTFMLFSFVCCTVRILALHCIEFTQFSRSVIPARNHLRMQVRDLVFPYFHVYIMTHLSRLSSSEYNLRNLCLS